MQRLGITLFLLLVGCGTHINDRIETLTSIPAMTFDMATPALLTDDETLRTLVQQFYADAECFNAKTLRDVIGVSIVTSSQNINEEAGVVGVSIVNKDRYNKEIYRSIELLKSFWDAASLTTKRTLLYHELGHAALNLNHQAVDSKQIMQPTLISKQYAEANWEDLIKFEFESSSL